MNIASLPLPIEAEHFLQRNGLLWKECMVESIPNGAGQVTLSPAVCLCRDLLLGETIWIVGMMCAHSSGVLYSATETIHFSTPDPVHAARELLLGDFQALFTFDGRPLMLEWTPAFQERLRHHHGPALVSHGLRAALYQRIAEAEGPSDEDLIY